MKKYIKPVFESVELRLDERMAGSCTPPPPYTSGACPTASL